jgi:hypothetical protein
MTVLMSADTPDATLACLVDPLAEATNYVRRTTAWNGTPAIVGFSPSNIIRMRVRCCRAARQNRICDIAFRRPVTLAQGDA